MLTTVTLIAGALVQPDALPGDYVGEWPAERNDELVWARYGRGVADALVASEHGDRPAIYLDAMYLDGLHICGVSYHGEEGIPEADWYRPYITRLETVDFRALGEDESLPVSVVTRNATEDQLDAHCPSMPTDFRARILDPREMD